MNTTAGQVSPQQFRTIALLGGIFFLRMFGLFILIPVLSLYALELEHATPVLIGLALGIYGLTQALFQIPLGMLSDRIGRKPVIFAGLVLFIIGSLIAAESRHIEFVILGRALQGAGAIAAAIMALLADVTAEQIRTRAMAVIGMGVGLAFISAMILGPLLGAHFGLAGLFRIGALLALVAMILLLMLPAEDRHPFHADVEVSLQLVTDILRDRTLLRYNLGVMLLHMILMATFVALPLILRDHSALADGQHWQLYLPVLVLSVVLMLPFLILADRKNCAASLYPAAVILLLAVQLGCLLGFNHFYFLAMCLVLFFTGFNYLEAALPAIVSRTITPGRKGTALGIYSTCQFLGAFLGGIGGGLCLEYSGYAAVFLFNFVAVLLWLAYLWLNRIPELKP
ncbi:MAG: MFS transporter [Thiotrichales bacterium]|nr:MFS transporter [Thiotrichales bacterium]